MLFVVCFGMSFLLSLLLLMLLLPVEEIKTKHTHTLKTGRYASMQKRSIQKLPARITVMGAARSGLAAARYLCDHGVHVFISDICPADELQFKLASNNLAQVAHEAQEHTERVLESDAILLSPGIPSNLWPLQVARRRAIPIWSEIELGFRRSSAPFLAITGSSGKSTTTCMLGEIVKASGTDCAVCGNIGVPVIAVAPQVAPEGLVIAEVSSFQLETIDTFKPQVAAVLNFQKNHLDRDRIDAVEI